MLGSPSHLRISTNNFPTVPDPASTQCVDGFMHSESMVSLVSQVVSSGRFGSGNGFTRCYSQMEGASDEMTRHQQVSRSICVGIRKLTTISPPSPRFVWRLRNFETGARMGKKVSSAYAPTFFGSILYAHMNCAKTKVSSTHNPKKRDTSFRLTSTSSLLASLMRRNSFPCFLSPSFRKFFSGIMS